MIVTYRDRPAFAFFSDEFSGWLIYFWPMHGFRYPLNDNQKSLT